MLLNQHILLLISREEEETLSLLVQLGGGRRRRTDSEAVAVETGMGIDSESEVEEKRTLARPSGDQEEEILIQKN
jgi:hypothetical protein